MEPPQYGLTILRFLLCKLHNRHRHYNTSIETRKRLYLFHSRIMPRRVVKNNRGFLQLLGQCPTNQCDLFLRAATPIEVHALVQALDNVLKQYIPIPEEIKK